MRPSWYLSEIKEKENKDWTITEMVKVYTMRVEEDIPVERVASKLKVSKCQIHNITRMMRKAVHGHCYKCNTTLTEEEMISKKPNRIIHLCFKCRKKLKKYKKKLRESFLKKGLCGYCGIRKKLKNRGSCKLCLSATNRRRERVGLCALCGKNPIRNDHPNGALCIICAEKMREKYVHS